MRSFISALLWLLGAKKGQRRAFGNFFSSVVLINSRRPCAKVVHILHWRVGSR